MVLTFSPLHFKWYGHLPKAQLIDHLLHINHVRNIRYIAIMTLCDSEYASNACRNSAIPLRQSDHISCRDEVKVDGTEELQAQSNLNLMFLELTFAWCCYWACYKLSHEQCQPFLEYTLCFLPNSWIIHSNWPASWSDSLTTNHKVPGSIPGSTMGIFPEAEDSCGDHGLSRLVEFRFKGPPGATSSYITTHIIGTT